MKTASTCFLFIALATMLYMNVGQVANASMDIRQAKQEAARRVAQSSHFTIITATEADFLSGKIIYADDHELRYDGRLYDIVKTTRDHGTFTFTVLHDDNEEGILANLKDIVDGWLTTPKSNKHHSSKQAIGIKDFVPAQKFSFNSNLDLEHLFINIPLSSAESPLLAVLKSPPKIG